MHNGGWKSLSEDVVERRRQSSKAPDTGPNLPILTELQRELKEINLGHRLKTRKTGRST